MKKKINLGNHLSLSKERLSQLNEKQLTNFLGGRMAATTTYTAGVPMQCSEAYTACCTTQTTNCCG